MKVFRHFILYFIFFGTIFIACEKKNIEPENIFESQINNINQAFEASEITQKNGITVILSHLADDNFVKTIKVTINSDESGSYKQTYDYKTGVSVSECSLNYTIVNKKDTTAPLIFTSLEGNVYISEKNRRKKQISGSYIFKLNSFPQVDKPYYIKGKFIKVKYE